MPRGGARIGAGRPIGKKQVLEGIVDQMTETEWASLASGDPLKFKPEQVYRLFWECHRARNAELALKVELMNLKREGK